MDTNHYLKAAALSCATLFSGLAGANVYDQPSTYKSWAMFRNLTKASYETKLDEYKDKGFRPVDVEIRSGSRWDVIFRKNTSGQKWIIKTTLTHQQFSEKWKAYRDAGYRLMDFETYTKEGTRFYAGIWLENSENVAWASYRNLSKQQFLEKQTSLKNSGMLPIDLEVYKSGSGLKYAGIWAKNTSNRQSKLFLSVESSSFSAHFKAQTDAGYRILDHNAYSSGGKTYFAPIWIKDGIKTLARRDMSSKGFTNYFRKFSDLGYRLEDVETYKVGADTRYAGVWIENVTRMTRWAKKSKTDQLIKSYLAANPAKGLTVAVSVKGKTTFKRGYGFYDSDMFAFSSTVYRLASISKAVSGTLGFILENRGDLDLDNDVGDYLDELPNFHSYTLGDLLTNRSMVRHYISNDPVNSAGQVANAWEATELFMDDALVVNSTGYNYSTHGYTVFAAAVEEATSRSFCWNLAARLSNRHGLSTLKCENRSSPVAYRSSLYRVNGSGDVVSTSADNLSWKYAGGGMEASALDLMKFANLLIKNRILPSQDVTEMTTRPDSSANYAYGWDVGSNDGNAVFAKSGGQRGSRTHLRVYPDKEIVIVLMANTAGSGSQMVSLARDIAKEIY